MTPSGMTSFSLVMNNYDIFLKKLLYFYLYRLML